MDLNKTLDKLIKDAQGEFIPYAHYIPEADAIHFYLKNEQTLARRVDEILTVYESAEDGEFAGCLIKGVSRLVRKTFQIQILRGEEHKATIAIMAYAAAEPLTWNDFVQHQAELVKVGDTEELVLA